MNNSSSRTPVKHDNECLLHAQKIIIDASCLALFPLILLFLLQSIYVIVINFCRELYRFQNKIEDGLAAIECLLVLDNTNVPEYLNNQSI